MINRIRNPILRKLAIALTGLMASFVAGVVGLILPVLATALYLKWTGHVGPDDSELFTAGIAGFFRGAGLLVSGLFATLIAVITPTYHPKGFCRKCGYALRGTISGVCPECGTHFEIPTQPAEATPDARWFSAKAIRRVLRQ